MSETTESDGPFHNVGNILSSLVKLRVKETLVELCLENWKYIVGLILMLWSQALLVLFLLISTNTFIPKETL